VPLVIEPRGSREQRAVGAGAMSTALTEGGLRQMRPGLLERRPCTALTEGGLRQMRSGLLERGP